VGISTAAPCSTRGLAGGDDIGGAVAVDGNLQATDFSIGDGLSGSLALSVNANVSGTLEIGNVSSGNYGVYGGSDSAATLPNGSTPIPNLYATSSTYPLPDFSTLNGELSTLSTTWGDATTYPTNGTMTTTVPGTLYLVGTDSSLDVFNLTAGQLAATVDLYINVPDGASVLVNVPDTSVDCTVTSCLNNVYYWDGSAYEPGTQYNNTYVEDVRGNTLLNFYNATSISLSTAGPAINILAPQASFTFDNGQMSGFVYADSVNGDFENDLPGGAVVPPPTTPTTALTTTTTALTTTTTALTTTTTALTTTTTALTTTATTMPVVPNTVGTTTTTPVVPNTVGTTTTTTAPAATTTTAPAATTTTAPAATTTTTARTHASHATTTTTGPKVTTTTGPKVTTTTGPKVTTTTGPRVTTSTTVPSVTTTTVPSVTTTTVPSKKLAFTGFDSGGMIGLGAALLLGGLGVIALSYRRRPIV
jgi:choice-of-anchor A domain-containing protein